MSSTMTRKVLAPALALVLIALAAFALGGGDNRKTLTVNFAQAISIYKGSDVAVMGVHIGRVTSVVPEGSSVKVTIEYDAKYHLPADVKAAIITPTLVADRFVQLAPAYTSGPQLPDGGDVPVDRTGVPVELDRIYTSLDTLTTTLGPTGANKGGALDALLKASVKALQGNGQLGNEMISNLSGAARTLGDNSGQLFGTVDNLAAFSQTLAQNDALVGGFIGHLSKVSGQLAGERDELRQALVALANAVGIVRTFVHDNKKLLVGDIKQLTTTIGVLAKQKETLGTVLQIAPLGLGNLADAFDVGSGTVGIRLQAGAAFLDLGNIFCGALTVNHAPNAEQACTLLKALLPAGGNVGAVAGGNTPTGAGQAPATGLGGLLGGLG